MQQRRSCRVLLHVISTIATLCSVASQTLLRRLQSVQNAAARLVTGTRRRDHITPVLRQLHWLPVRQRVDFKTALLVYKALRDSTAAHLVDDCQLVSQAGRRRLRSADIDTCSVPRTNTRFGDRSFAVAGPRLWNSLPARIRQLDNDIGEFRRQLKSFLFQVTLRRIATRCFYAPHKYSYSLTHLRLGVRGRL